MIGSTEVDAYRLALLSARLPFTLSEFDDSLSLCVHGWP
jgi:hypothetical protein